MKFESTGCKMAKWDGTRKTTYQDLFGWYILLDCFLFLKVQGDFMVIEWLSRLFFLGKNLEPPPPKSALTSHISISR